MVATASATEPDRWSDLNPGRPVPFVESVQLDIVAHLAPEDRPSRGMAWLVQGLKVGLRSSGFHVCLLYRIGHLARYRWGIPGRLVSAWVFWWTRHFYGCSIAPSSRIFGGLILPHPQGIVIGAGSVIGPRGWIFQNVTVGGAPGKSGMPVIGCDVRIYAGAVVSGPVVLGDNVMLGANVVVSRDVPSRRVIRPAQPEIVPIPSHFEAGEA